MKWYRGRIRAPAPTRRSQTGARTETRDTEWRSCATSGDQNKNNWPPHSDTCANQESGREPDRAPITGVCLSRQTNDTSGGPARPGARTFWRDASCRRGQTRMVNLITCFIWSRCRGSPLALISRAHQWQPATHHQLAGREKGARLTRFHGKRLTMDLAKLIHHLASGPCARRPTTASAYSKGPGSTLGSGPIASGSLFICFFHFPSAAGAARPTGLVGKVSTARH